MNSSRNRQDRESSPPNAASAGHAPSSPPQKGGRQALTGVVEQFSKQNSASHGVLALSLIKRAFGDAIEYSATFSAFRGMVMFFGIAAAGFAFYGTWSGIANIGHLPLVIQIFGLAIAVIFAIVGLGSVLVTARMELFAPADQPVIFDRKNRRVYQMYQQQAPGWKGLFKPWPVKVDSFDWDLVDAQHVARMSANSATVTRRHQLRFVVRRSADDPTVVAMFQVGTPQLMGGPMVPLVWEHIRRFMEEGGPAVPPGEGTLSEIGPLSWRGTYLSWWRMFTFPMILMHLILPISIALVLVLAFLNWLTRITAVPAVWPKDIQDAIGEQVMVLGDRSPSA